MAYTGDVSPGGPPDVRELDGLTVTKISVGPMDNNAYFLRCTHTGDVLLIDAANEADRLLSLLGDDRLVRIVTTHRHDDHVQALPEVSRATGAPVAAHPLDASSLPVTVTEYVDDGDTVRVGRTELSVIHLVGHTSGSIALLYDGGSESASPHLFTGDSLFPGGVGNTFGNQENFERLIDDVEGKIFDRLPDATWFYPGHGNDSTLGNDRPHLGEWRERGW